MRFLRRAFWILILLAAAIFAVINMQVVEVVIDPLGLGFQALKPLFLPLAYVIFLSLGVGLLVGVLLENDRGRPNRRELREKRAEVAKLRAEVQRMHQTMKAADHPDSAGLPVIRR